MGLDHPDTPEDREEPWWSVCTLYRLSLAVCLITTPVFTGDVSAGAVLVALGLELLSG